MMDLDGFDDIVKRRRQRRKQHLSPEYMPQPIQHVAPERTPPPPWTHVPSFGRPQSKRELVYQRDSLKRHLDELSDRHTEYHVKHAAGDLPPGHGMHLLTFPHKLAELAAMHESRDNQLLAISAYSKSQILRAYNAARRDATVEQKDATPSLAIASNLTKTELIQLMTQELDVDSGDLLPNLAAVA